MRKNLYFARREKRLTQEEVAKIICVSKQTYYLKENEKTDFTLSEAQMLANFFDTTVDQLFEN